MALELAQTNKIDLGKIIPTGEGRRITYSDIKAIVEPRTFRYYNEIKTGTKRVKLDLKRHANPELVAEAEQKDEPPAPSQPLPLAGSTVPAHINPKSEIPHFWLKKRLEVDTLDRFLKELPQDRRVGVDGALIKFVKDSIALNPDFYNFRVRGKFFRAKQLWINYKNLADPKLNRTVRLDEFSKMSFEGSEAFDPDRPTFKIIDASGTDIVAIMPVLRENQV